ncbi:hypothetical protein E4T39_05255, partial [Aureobasidium subglaciale]
NQHPPEVDIINAVIRSDDATTGAWNTSSARLPGKLPKIPKKSSSNRLQRLITTAPRTRLLGVDASPMTSAINLRSKISRSLPKDNPRELSNKRQKRGQNARVQNLGGAHKPASAKGDAPELGPRRKVGASPLPAASTSSTKNLRFLGIQAEPAFDPAIPINQQVGKNGRASLLTQHQHVDNQTVLPTAINKTRSITRTQGQKSTRPRGAVQNAVDTVSPSQSADLNIESDAPPLSLPTIAQAPDTLVEEPHQPVLDQDRHTQASPCASTSETTSLPQVNSMRPTRNPPAESGGDASQPTVELSQSRARSRTRVSGQAEATLQNLESVVEEDDPQDETFEDKTHETETDHLQIVPVPEALIKALEFARAIHKQADSDRSERTFDRVHILKAYNSLERTIDGWRAEKDYGRTSEVIKLSRLITKEAEAVLKQPNWNTATGFKYMFTRVLPTVVRLLHNSLTYYLSEAGIMTKLTYEQVKISRSIARTIVYLSDQAMGSRIKTIRSRNVISMIKEIKLVHGILEQQLTALKDIKPAEKYSQRQQLQQLRQEIIDAEEEDERKLMRWRENWRILHDQRLGAELEGRVFFNVEKEKHLKLIPLEKSDVPYPHWDPDVHVYPLVEGLQELTGPDVYRKIFHKYCRYGGPLQPFNVSEIVEKAVSLKKQFMKEVLMEGDEREQWIIDIPDPRKPPVVVWESCSRR